MIFDEMWESRRLKVVHAWLECVWGCFYIFMRGSDIMDVQWWYPGHVGLVGMWVWSEMYEWQTEVREI